MHDATALPPARQAPPLPAADARATRIAAIHDQAVVCRLVGIAAMHRRLPSGRHVITHRGQGWTGDTLDQAIDAATRRAGR